MVIGITRVPAMILLLLKAADATAFYEEAFLWGAIIIGETIWEEIFREVYGKMEETLSVYSRDLNESTNVVGIFNYRQLNAPDWSGQETYKKEKCLSGQEYQYDAAQKSSSVRISIIVERSKENTYVCSVFCGN